MRREKRNRVLKIGLFIFAGILALFIIGFYIYASDYYRADEEAVETLKGENVEVLEGITVFHADRASDTGLIFYPGAKVEYTAYAPLLDKLSEEGINCVAVEMPFNMAIFDSDAADELFEEFPDIEQWYIGGHSMGGAMASSYASKNEQNVEGLILLGAYIYGDYPPEESLTVYGSLNSSVGEKIDYDENIVVIEGGNHAQFGNYGEQRGDQKATISREEQQRIAVEEIVEFIEEDSDN